MIPHQSFLIQHEICVTLVNLAHLTILKNKKSSFQQIHISRSTSSFASFSASKCRPAYDMTHGKYNCCITYLLTEYKIIAGINISGGVTTCLMSPIPRSENTDQTLKLS